jgi:hypothetical protein
VILSATNQSLELVTSTANAVHWSVAWTDVDKSGASTVATPGSAHGTVSAATDTTIVAAPSASVYRVVTEVSVVAVGGACTVTVQKDVAGTEYAVHVGALLVGQKLGYAKDSGWDVYNADGQRQTSGADGADGTAGAPGLGNSGTATVDFGAWPGTSDATVTVTGQVGILGTSVVEAWLRLEATADHSADEHLLETIKVAARDIVEDDGFTIHAVNSGTLGEPDRPLLTKTRTVGPAGPNRPDPTVDGTRIYGTWTVQWRWS